jgi:hypothetical protein
MYWGVIDPEGGRSTNNILLQGRLKICYQFIDLLVYKSGASNHQATEVQIADILTKDLGGKAHRRHRDVIVGKKAIEIIASKLPGSCRMYLTRNNDELKKNAQAVRLAQARAK